MKQTKTFALILAVVLMAATLFGCGGKPALAAKVGDQEVTVTQLANSYKNSSSYATSYGYDITTEEGATQVVNQSERDAS